MLWWSNEYMINSLTPERNETDILITEQDIFVYNKYKYK